MDAAETIFGEQGYHEAGIAEITQAAEVAMGTFYVYFPDKRAVFADLVRLLNARLRADIQAAVAAFDDRVDKEVEGFSAFFAFARRHRNLYRVIRQAEFVDEPLYQWHYQTIAKGYVRGLRAAQARGQIESRHDPETLAYALMGMAEAVGMRFVLWERRTPPAAVLRTLRRIFESGLRPAKRKIG